jgi:hypothetical protein
MNIIIFVIKNMSLNTVGCYIERAFTILITYLVYEPKNTRKIQRYDECFLVVVEVGIKELIKIYTSLIFITKFCKKQCFMFILYILIYICIYIYVYMQIRRQCVVM